MTVIVANCPDCNGRGWVSGHRSRCDVWPNACNTCEGTGRLTRKRLAALLAPEGELRELYYRAIEAVQAGRPTRRRGIIVLAALAKAFPHVLNPKAASR